MRAGRAKAAAREFGRGTTPRFDPGWRKPKRLTLWQRITRWLNNP